MLDPIDVFYGLLPALTGYAAFVSWANLIVRAIRGEAVKEDWRVWASTSAFLGAVSLVLAARVRQAEALHGAAVEMRELVRESKAEALRREQAAIARDQRDSSRNDRMYRLTTWLVALAALTLAAAIVSVVLSLAQ